MNKKEWISLLRFAKVPILLLLVIWFVFLVDKMGHFNFYVWGVYPKSALGLRGILFSPFIHSTKDYSHIINNSVPLVILGWTLFYFYSKQALRVLLYAWFFGGLFIWLASRPSYHIGMSGVLYALAFFLFFSGVWRKEVRVMAISLFVVFLYGSMVWGIFPTDPQMSFEAHLYGAVIGISCAYFFRNEGARFVKRKYQWEVDEEEEKRMLEQGYVKVVDPESGFLIRYEKPENINFIYDYIRESDRESNVYRFLPKVPKSDIDSDVNDADTKE